MAAPGTLKYENGELQSIKERVQRYVLAKGGYVTCTKLPRSAL